MQRLFCFSGQREVFRSVGRKEWSTLERAMVKLENIKKSFSGNEILKGIDLTINTGEVVVILGPSGSGKTTLLRCINFLEAADEGSVTVDDKTVQCKKAGGRDILELRRKTAMVFQNYNLFRNKTLLENVIEGPLVVRRATRKEATDKAVKLLDKVGLGERLDNYPSQVSGGQQQRAGIVRALIMNPEVILFDEPTSALDPELVGEVLATIKAVAKTGITMIVVTHEIAFAREVADRVVFMADGRIVEQGPPGEVIEHPREERTRDFLSRLVGEQAS